MKYKQTQYDDRETGYTVEEEGGTCNLVRWILGALNVINHVLVLLVTGFVAYLALPDLSATVNLHALLCTIGYPFLMAEAITALAGENAYTRFLSRRSSSHVHWILQVIGAICSVSGVVLMFFRKEEVGRSHFYSTHALYGIISVGGICLVFLSGLPALFAARLRKTIRPVYSKFIHNTVGTTCFLLGMTSQCYGYQKGMFRRSHPGMINWMTGGTIAIALLSLIGALRQYRVQLTGVVKTFLR